MSDARELVTCVGFLLIGLIAEFYLSRKIRFAAIGAVAEITAERLERVKGGVEGHALLRLQHLAQVYAIPQFKVAAFCTAD